MGLFQLQVSLQRAEEVLSPGDLPKSHVPPTELGRGARPPVLNPLVIPRSLCAERGGKSFCFSRLFFRTQPVLCSTPALLPFSSALDFTFTLLLPHRKYQPALVSCWGDVQGQFLFITHVPQLNSQDSFDLKHNSTNNNLRGPMGYTGCQREYTLGLCR